MEEMTTREAAKLLNLAVGTVQKMVDSGILQGWKTQGGHRRVSKTSVDEFIRQKQSPGAPAALGDSAHARSDKVCVIVEDSIFYQNAISRIVSGLKPSWSIEIANDGFDGLELIHDRQADLVILDLALPGVDGYTVLQKILSKDPQMAKKIVIVTGLEETELERHTKLLRDLPLIKKTELSARLGQFLTEFEPLDSGHVSDSM